MDIDVAYLLDWNIAARVCLLSHIGSLGQILGCGSLRTLPLHQLLRGVHRLFLLKSSISRLIIVIDDIFGEPD